MGGVLTRLFATYANILSSVFSTISHKIASINTECSSTTARSAEIPNYLKLKILNSKFKNQMLKILIIWILLFKFVLDFVLWYLSLKKLFGISVLRTVHNFGIMLSPVTFSARGN